MKSTKFIKETSLAAAILLLVMFCGVNSVAAAQEADKWQYELTIYAWLPSIDGDLKYDIGGGDGATIDASSIIDSLNFVFMGTFEAHRNKLSFGADFIYMDVSNSKSTNITIGPGIGPGVPLSVSAGLDLKTLVFTGIVGYDLVQTDKARTAVVGGLRYLTLDADTSLSINGPPPPNPPPAYMSESASLWDGIVGVKGTFMLNEHWYLPYYADIGTGDSKMTWQLYGAIGYKFHWGDIRLGYRYLEYDSDDKFLEDLKLYGPLLGIGFRF